MSVRAPSQCGLSIGSVKVIRHKKYEFSAGELWKTGTEERNVIQGMDGGENRGFAEEKSNGTIIAPNRRQGCTVDSHSIEEEAERHFVPGVDNLGMGELSSYIGGPSAALRRRERVQSNMSQLTVLVSPRRVLYWLCRHAHGGRMAHLASSSAVPDQKLRSLAIFLDVIFALMFFRIVEFLPSFQDGRWVRLPHGILSLLASQPANLTRVVFGLVITVYYWNRKNALFSVLARSNSVLATLSIASVSFLCLFMYALVADPMYAGGVPTLVLQSVSLAIASLLGLFRPSLCNSSRPDVARGEGVR